MTSAAILVILILSVREGIFSTGYIGTTNSALKVLPSLTDTECVVPFLSGVSSMMPKGSHHSEETKSKISAAKKGTHLSKEHKIKISEWHKNNPFWLGKHLKKETKEKISKSKKGKKSKRIYCNLTDETKKKMSIAKWKGGRKATKERQKKKPNYLIKRRMSARILKILKRRGGAKSYNNWETLVGYKVDELINHLKKHYPKVIHGRIL